jgi:hydroxymethylglutaryl-CoA synthase
MMRYVDPSHADMSPANPSQMCLLREKAHLKKNFSPAGETETLVPGTYYLTNVDDMFRRAYEIKA